ncbi:MAG: fimbria/pilus outer membrane usher protein [Casimicrobiaceae bacterium]
MIRAERWCQVALLLFLATLAHISQAQSPPGSGGRDAREQAPLRELLLQVDINRQGLQDATVLVQRKAGELLASDEDLRKWRLHVPDVAPETLKGVAYFSLHAIPGLTYDLDMRTLKLSISVPADAFSVAELSAPGSVLRKPTTPSLGGYFNYDLVTTHGSGTTQGAGVFEVAAFGPLGVIVSNMLAQTGANVNKATRLETTFTHDDPVSLTSLRIGDTVTAPGAWGRSVRFGGIQYATNFGTQPGFITLPLLSAAGSAALPSAVDVYVNNVLAAHKDVAPGPFDVNSLPPVTGQGQVRVVVTDLLGRQQSVVQPFYSSTDLLREGLHDFSYSAGALRNNFGLASNDYGDWFGQASYRRGITNSLTAEVRAEVTQHSQVTLGGAVSFLLPGLLGEVNVGGAGSHNEQGNGALALLGYQLNGSIASFGFQTQWTTPRFSLLGADTSFPVPKLLTSAFAGLNLAQYGSMTASYVLLDPYNNIPLDPSFNPQVRTEVGILSYSIGIFDRATLSVSASRALSGERSNQFSVNVIVPLDSQTSASGTYNKISGKAKQQEFTAQVQRNLPLGDGYGYRVLATDHGNVLAGGAIQTNLATFGAEVARFEGATSYRAGVAGGIGTVGGRTFLSRPITDSFALVDVADYPGVQVYQDNQPVGRTGRDGTLLLTRLRSYDINPIRIDPLDLPFDAQIDGLSLDIVPYYRSGVHAAFEVRHSNGAIMTVVGVDGQPLPTGSVVTVDGSVEKFPVGIGGRAYLTGLAPTNRVRSQVGGRACQFDVTFQPVDDTLPDLGTFVCRGAMQ